MELTVDDLPRILALPWETLPSFSLILTFVGMRYRETVLHSGAYILIESFFVAARVYVV